MDPIQFSIPIRPYSVLKSADNSQEQLSFDFQLLEGVHTVNTSYIPVVSLLKNGNDTNLQLQLAFTYDYNAEEKMITISSPEEGSEDSMHLVSASQDHTSHHLLFASEIPEKIFKFNINSDLPLLSEQEDTFKMLVQTAYEELFNTLKNVEGLSIRVKTPPPVLSSELENELLLVYKDQELAGLFDPNVNYGKNYTVKSIRSVWGGKVTFAVNADFANVIGSTYDPKIDGSSWIKLWESSFGAATVCSSYNFAGNYPGKFTCNDSLVGGHIIKGKAASAVPKGSNDVYIIPICKAHNNNNSIYMEAIKYQGAVWLKNFMN
ncbi:hypothetical protein [Chryseobacterium sp. JUb7]|uniref:hypothetical protein n=1 Tax=Chryseobacterium sp. JUb7 TaxID=2940599 RepID=UPI00216A571C|nr:hypothetical protein [Chryseobacterium sp. JUb7]MCS3532943.1 hypothetical protein [Chryseobacterium sp. JUb7]